MGMALTFALFPLRLMVGMLWGILKTGLAMLLVLVIGAAVLLWKLGLW